MRCSRVPYRVRAHMLFTDGFLYICSLNSIPWRSSPLQSRYLRKCAPSEALNTRAGWSSSLRSSVHRWTSANPSASQSRKDAPRSISQNRSQHPRNADVRLSQRPKIKNYRYIELKNSDMKLVRRQMWKAKWLRNHTFTQKLLEVCRIEGIQRYNFFLTKTQKIGKIKEIFSVLYQNIWAIAIFVVYR